MARFCSSNIFFSIKDISEKETYRVAYYLYRLFLDFNSFDSYDDCFLLFYSILDKLKKVEDTEKLLDYIIQSLIREKKLTPFNPTKNYKHPFAYPHKLKLNFKEDAFLFSKHSNQNTDDLFYIKLFRCIFSNNEKYNFSKIIAWSLFCEDSAYEKRIKLFTEKLVSNKIKKNAFDMSNIKFLIDATKLDNDEANLLNLAYRTHIIKELYFICNNFVKNDFNSILIYAKLLNKTVNEVKYLLREDKKLVIYNFLSKDGKISDEVITSIMSGKVDDLFSDVLKEYKNKKVFPLDSFSVKKSYQDLSLNFLKSSLPCNILLYGVPGAGKTEFAKSIIKKSMLKTFIYKDNNDYDDNEQSLKRLNCLLSIQKSDSVIIVDEAENILKTRGFSWGIPYSLDTKSLVNNMLDNSVNKVIWIVNYIESLDESTRRRFTYSIKFDEMPEKILRSITLSKLNKLEIEPSFKNELIDLYSEYKVTGASVDNMIKTIKCMDYSSEKKESKENLVSAVKNVLEANSELIYGKVKNQNKINNAYSLSVLNTSTPANEIVQMIHNSLEYEKNNPSVKSGINLLFYGLSGTGKSNLAYYIAESLNKKIIVKRASDILNKYVGENEQNIKSAFAEAEAKNAVLLFDEADSFFSDRTNANSGWQVTMVNEFLTQMEDFEGILICTTNLRKNMDPAMQRRFQIITEFKALNENGIKELLKKYFTQFKFNKTQVEELNAYESITPGDFSTLAQRARFMSSQQLSDGYIITELAQMQKEKQGSRTIGFVG